MRPLYVLSKLPLNVPNMRLLNVRKIRLLNLFTRNLFGGNDRLGTCANPMRSKMKVERLRALGLFFLFRVAAAGISISSKLT